MATTHTRAALGYLGEAELAEFLGISTGRLRNRMVEGSVPPTYKIGKQNVFCVREVQAWIKAQRRDGRRLRSDSRRGPAGEDA